MTSIEFLFKELWETSKDKLEWHSILEKAKEMHKQEIIDAHNQSWQTRDNPYKTAENYYQETFVSKGSDEHIVDTNEMISDEEIEEASEFYKYKINKTFFIEGAKWYREQLKQRQ